MSVDQAIIEAIRQVAQIPTERRLWSLATIAEYAELSASHIAQKVVCQPDFPRPIRILGSGKPRWKAGDVMAWFEANQAASPVQPQKSGSRT